MPNTYTYLDSGSTHTTNGFINITGNATIESPYFTTVVQVDPAKGIHPLLYFRYVKSKFGILEKQRLDNRLKKLEKAFNKAVEMGQDALGEKLLLELARETRESTLYVKGIKYFIEKDDLDKYKNRIREGHISDTRFKDYTRIIPDKVLKRKKEVENFFDGFVIYHYYNSKTEGEREKKQKMSSEEKAKMRDPVLFGVIKESNRLYFIADWEDEYCDLTFEEMVDMLGKDEQEIRLTREPKLI